MQKYIFLFSIILLLVDVAVSDSIYIENPNCEQYKVYTDSRKLADTQLARKIIDLEPDTKETNFYVVAEQLKLALLSSTNNKVLNKTEGCNYALNFKNLEYNLISINENVGCTKSKRDSKIRYYFVNQDKSIPVYPSFSVNKENNFAPDSILGFLYPKQIRAYTIGEDYWNEIGVEKDSKIQPAVFNPYQNKYIPCEKSANPINKSKTFVFAGLECKEVGI